MFQINQWLTGMYRPKGNQLSLYCLPHAGGNSEDYLNWQSDLIDGLYMKAIVFPGCGRRHNEEHISNINELITELTSVIEQDCEEEFYIFGHSMGAILAWEIAKKIRKKPSGLLLSASLSPSEIPSPRILRMADMNNESFIKEIKFFNGLDENILSNPFISEIIADKLKRDFKLISQYRYFPTGKVDIPIMAIVGHEDAHVPAKKMLQWQGYTNNFLGLRAVDGNHFYFNEHPEAVVDAINSMVKESREKIGHYPIII